MFNNNFWLLIHINMLYETRFTALYIPLWEHYSADVSYSLHICNTYKIHIKFLLDFLFLVCKRSHIASLFCHLCWYYICSILKLLTGSFAFLKKKRLASQFWYCWHCCCWWQCFKLLMLKAIQFLLFIFATK